MKIKLGGGRLLKIDKLKCDCNFRNRDKETYEKLMLSLIKYGNLTPVTITPSFLLLDGYARIAVFKELGVNEINTNTVRLTSEEAKKFILTQAQITSGANFDFKTFSQHILKQKISSKDLERLGFFVPNDDDYVLQEDPNQLSIYDLKPISYPKVKEIDYSLL